MTICAARERADAQPRIAADENADLAELGAAIDGRGDEPDPARHFADAHHVDLRHLTGGELGQKLGRKLAQQFKFATRDDLKQRRRPDRGGGADGGVDLENDARRPGPGPTCVICGASGGASRART